jgi:hypothetical protein
MTQLLPMRKKLSDANSLRKDATAADMALYVNPTGDG